MCTGVALQRFKQYLAKDSHDAVTGRFHNSFQEVSKQDKSKA